MIRTAWIDRESKLVSFHRIAKAGIIREEEEIFWQILLMLSRHGYSFQ